MAHRMSRLAGDSLVDVFLLRCELQRCRQQSWCAECEPLFPGYLFLEVADVALLERALAQSTEYARLLRIGDNAVPLTQEESAFVRELGGADHVIRMSVGEVVEGSLHVWAGPLAGRERLVANYNRHKRMAWLSTGFHRAGVTRVGLEVVRKV